MEFSKLVSYTECIGEGKKPGLLIIVSSFNAYALVLRHLSLLSSQTFRKFDVLLVLGVPFEDRKLAAHLKKRKCPFRIIIAKENERRGCSGAFFTGQKYALEQGYDYAIMADDDCMPVDRKLVGELWRNREKGYVAPTTRFVVDGYRKAGFCAGPTQYTLFSTSVFRRHGLYFLPLFQGADDGEYMERLGAPSLHIGNYTEHPYISGMRIFEVFDRSWVFFLSSLIITKGAKREIFNLAQFCFLLCASLFFLPSYGRKIFSVMTRLLLTFTYGKKAHDEMKSGFQDFISVPAPPDARGFARINEKEPEYIDRRIAGKLSEIMRQSMQFFRKGVVVEKTYSFFRVFFIAIFAKKVYVRMQDRKLLLVADNGSALAHVAKLAVFPFFLAAYSIAVSAVFLAEKVALQPKTEKYGLK